MTSTNQIEKSGKIWQLIAFIFIGLFILSLVFNIDFSSLKLKKGESDKSLSEKKSSLEEENVKKEQSSFDIASLQEKVLPSKGAELPVVWGDLGKQMVEKGVIDADKFEGLYERRGGLGDYEKELLYGEGNGRLKIDAQNAPYLLNLFWALGLGNKNPILEEGPMIKYGGDAGIFASTGGWSLAEGRAMDHYSKHEFVVLSSEQQNLVEEVSQNIYRPCCGNPTYFPDCNHGMAMLGLLELMASQGASEEEMYKVALQVNSYWFPSTYLTIAKYFGERGVNWQEVNPKDVLGSSYSSAQGYRQILSEVEPPKSQGGSGCGI